MEDHNGMSVLTREECYERIGYRGVGRVAVTVGALPAIFPVNYAVHDGDVYFRTAAGTKLAAASRRAVVAFEADDVDRFAHGGWSVQIVGPSGIVDQPDDLAALDHLPLTRWVGAGLDTLVRVRGALVSGRHITPLNRSALAARSPEPAPSSGSKA